MSDPVSEIVGYGHDRKQSGEDLTLIEVLARHPELYDYFDQSPARLDEARQRIEKLRQFEQPLASSMPGTEVTPANTDSPPTKPEQPPSTRVIPQIPNYTIIEKLGSGGMGDVFKAIQNAFGRLCAIKTISRKYAFDEEMVARFNKEILAVANLNHPQIVTVYDLVRVGNTLYLAMEFIDGLDLARYVRQH